jgi:hypothetical protein
MEEAMSFEDLLKTNFRWPQQGDQPFRASEDWSKNANLEMNVHTRLVLMTDGYKMGADLMVGQAAVSNYERNCLVYAVIFNYRHFLELSLKYLVAWYGPTVDVEPNWSSHSLSTLWTEFTKVLDRYGVDDPLATNPIVENVVAEFAKIDPNSYAYRYPVDVKGNPIPVAVAELNLDTLKGMMDGVAGFFQRLRWLPRQFEKRRSIILQAVLIRDSLPSL